MFDNSGKKLKTFAGVLFVLSVLGSIFSFISSVGKRPVLSLVLLPVSLLLCYAVCFAIYVFGYLGEYFSLADSNLHSLAAVKAKVLANRAEKENTSEI